MHCKPAHLGVQCSDAPRPPPPGADSGPAAQVSDLDKSGSSSEQAAVAITTPHRPRYPLVIGMIRGEPHTCFLHKWRIMKQTQLTVFNDP